MCVQATLTVSMRVKAPATSLIRMSNYWSPRCEQGVAQWVIWFSSHSFYQDHLSFSNPVFYLHVLCALRSLNALFEICLSD